MTSTPPTHNGHAAQKLLIKLTKHNKFKVLLPLPASTKLWRVSGVCCPAALCLRIWLYILLPSCSDGCSLPYQSREVQWKSSNMDKLLIPLPCQEYLATSIRGPQTVEQLIKASELGKAAIAPPKDYPGKRVLSAPWRAPQDRQKSVGAHTNVTQQRVFLKWSLQRQHQKCLTSWLGFRSALSIMHCWSVLHQAWQHNTAQSGLSSGKHESLLHTNPWMPGAKQGQQGKTFIRNSKAL